MARTMRELVAYSKQINISETEKKRFQASLMDKKIDLGGGAENKAKDAVISKIRQLEEMSARRYGFIK